MRKIEEKIVDAIKNMKDFAGGNTEVRINLRCAYVYLHNNLIAEILPNVGLIRITSSNWRTARTKSRLNAILSLYGYAINQNKGIWYLHNEDGFKVFEDDMLLNIK